MYKNNKNNKKKFKNLGFYIEHSLINPKLSYEYINECSFIVRNIDRTQQKINNVFEWNNRLDNKIKRLLYIYIHILSIPNNPWLNKVLSNLFDTNFKNNLLINKTLDTSYTFNSINYIVGYYDSNIIDFIINDIYTDYYSYEINNDKFYKYSRSTKNMYDEPFIYLNIDVNNNLENNTMLSTNKILNNFSYKLAPIGYTDDYVYYKALKQFILKTINTIKSIDNLTISLHDSSNKKLTNTFLNTNLYTSSECNCDEDNIKASCYCSYIRHPYNKQNQIDISFKIGLINNEIVNNVFH
jgi:hypothetical protein